MKKTVILCVCANALTIWPVRAAPFISDYLRPLLSRNSAQILVADHSVTAGDLTIKDAFTRPTLGGATVAVGYVTIVNKGKIADRLIGASSNISATAEIHESKMSNGMMEMHELKDGLAIPAGASVALKPGSYHIMFLGLKQPVKGGTKIRAVLTFAKAGKVDVTFPAAASPGAMAPDMGNMQMQ